MDAGGTNLIYGRGGQEKRGGRAEGGGRVYGWVHSLTIPVFDCGGGDLVSVARRHVTVTPGPGPLGRWGDAPRIPCPGHSAMPPPLSPAPTCLPTQKWWRRSCLKQHGGSIDFSPRPLPFAAVPFPSHPSLQGLASGRGPIGGPHLRWLVSPQRPGAAPPFRAAKVPGTPAGQARDRSPQWRCAARGGWPGHA